MRPEDYHYYVKPIDVQKYVDALNRLVDEWHSCPPFPFQPLHVNVRQSDEPIVTSASAEELAAWFNR